MPNIKILNKENVYNGFNKIINYKFEFESFDNYKDKLICEKEFLVEKMQ